MVSIIIPVFNEENNIPQFYQRVLDVMEKSGESYEFVFIDDGSTDNSFQVISNLRKNDKSIKFIQFSRNFGQQIALSAGIDHATGEAAIMMDADLQHPPELIPELIRKWKEGYDIVYTIRKENKGYGYFRKITSHYYYSLMTKLLKIDIQEGAADFRLLSRPVLDSLKNCKERNRFIRGLVFWVGYKRFAIPYIADVRFTGKTKYSFNKMLQVAICGITSFSSVPLYIASVLGFLIAGFSFLYAVFAIYEKFFSNKVLPGWTSILVSVLFLGGVQLIAIGILGEYLARVYEEVKQRPLYIVKKMIGLNEKE